MKEQPGMAKKHTASSLDTPASNLATASPIALTAPRRSHTERERERETAVSSDDVESYQLPSHQFESASRPCARLHRQRRTSRPRTNSRSVKCTSSPR